ncbi:MAG: outer membrane protein assembly factor BamD [Burkholderiaceae bacterium]|jgi:outer membrane protein assembly factor BamD|nr:outer membrane protein assembly factor BamD [Burkholderiaceae bacterium]MDH5207494.1 outer membrane protein assembly factor BamD [Burkholderiaceae bacterium]
MTAMQDTRRFARWWARLALLLAAAALAGCSWLGDLGKADQTAKWDADKLYAEARIEIGNGAWAKARELLQKLESRFPFGRHAQQALMEIAYTYYKEGESAQAIQACDRFIRQYPNHPSVDYVYYLKGLASYNEDLGLIGRVLSQDVSDRDAKAAREAFDVFKDLVNRFPDSKYADDARARMRYLLNAQAQAEVNVARFYFARKAYLAAIQRSQTVVREFQRSPAVEEALGLMVRSYAALDMEDLQADAERVLRLNFPESRFLPKQK